MADKESNVSVLSTWFENAGGSLDSSAMGFATFPEAGGRGAVALRDLDEGHVLFTLPRTLTLSTRTSTLPKLLGDAWIKHGLHEGWSGLILCVLWEEAKGASSKWSGYLATLPTEFDTPMFWSEEELVELQGTAVVDKIGRAQAEENYHQKVLPTMKLRPDLFPQNTMTTFYSVDAYHRAGSRILSRSFTVQKLRGAEDENDNEDPEASADHDEAEDPDLSQGSIVNSGMDVDNDAGEAALVAEVEQAQPILGDEADSDDEEDSPADVALVPIADMLNARYGASNAKLFYEPAELKMMTTKSITKGEQIWNTYGDPPNSDLLRRYGHVDILSPSTLNPADVVELRADMIVNALPAKLKAGAMERVDWWLDEDGDDVFVVETDRVVPELLLSFVRLMQLTAPEWTKAREKSKMPKPKALDAEGARVVCTALRARLAEYATTLEADEVLLSSDAFTTLPSRRQHAIVVRVGEKRILLDLLRELERIADVAKRSGSAKGDRKVKDDKEDKTGGGSKKRRAHGGGQDEGATSAKKARK